MEQEFDRVALLLPQFEKRLKSLPETVKRSTFDIRLKEGQPLCLCGSMGMLFLRKDGSVTKKQQDDLPLCGKKELQELFFEICGQSVFHHEDEIRSGYLSLKNGYRVGVCGTAVREGETVRTIKEISSLVFRIPRERRGCADRLFLSGVPVEKGVLIAGPPSSGKTTFLRDLSKALSEGRFSAPCRLAVLDERGELGGAFDLGPGADILSGYPKKAAFETALRMLSPQYLVCDELITEDLKALDSAIFAGATVIATVHALRQDFLERSLCRRLLKSGAFSTVVFLKDRSSPGSICEIKSAKVLLGEEKRILPLKNENRVLLPGNRRRHEISRSGSADPQRIFGGAYEKPGLLRKRTGAA